MSQTKKAPWDRQTKHWCRYCQIFIHDNKTTRSLHESGAKHKTNVQKYLRKIQKDSETERKAKDELKVQLNAINKAAMASLNNGSQEVNSTVQSPATSAHTKQRIQKKDTKREPSEVCDGRPQDMGVIGAWEQVVEDEEQVNETETTESERASGLRGAEWLDEEDDKPAEFTIAEKTIEVSTTEQPSPATNITEGLFKKRKTRRRKKQ